MTSTASTLNDRIRQRLDYLGLSPEGASKKAGLSRDVLRKLLAVQNPNPRTQTVEKLAGALEVSPLWLLNGSEDAEPVAPPTKPHAAPADIAKRIPIYGTAAGAALGAVALSQSEVIDWALCPPALANVPDAYGLYVIKDSMMDRFREGDLIFAHPHRPVRRGDPVVVQVTDNGDDTIAAFIKEFRNRTETEIITEQYNPQGEVRFNRAKVRAMHRVLTTNELFGL